MTREGIEGLLSLYRETLLRHGVVRPEEIPLDEVPPAPKLENLLRLCNMIETLLLDGHLNDAERGIRFLRGAMWWTRLRSMRQLNAEAERAAS